MLLSNINFNAISIKIVKIVKINLLRICQVEL